MRGFNFVIRLIIGFIFIFSAIAKLYPIEPFEIVFVDLGVSNWLLAPFIARVVIAFELFLGLSILFKQWFYHITYYLAQATLFFFTIYLVFLIITKGVSADCGCFGSWISLNPLASILKNGLLIVGLFLIKKDNYSRGLNWVLPLVFLITSFVSVFLLNRVGLHNVQATAINQSINLTQLPALYKTNSKVDFGKGNKVVAFLSAGCSHCKNAAYKLAYLEKDKHPQNLIVVLAAAEEKEIQPFLDDTKLTLPFIWMNDDTFFNYSGGKLPAFIYTQNGILKKKWTGEFIDIEELGALLE